MTGATETIADFATSARSGVSPTAQAVGRVLQDTVAVTVAGLEADVAGPLLSWLEGERAPGAAALWGTDETASPSQAALVNGTLSHALDWDDAVPSMAMHPGAVLVPALVAMLASEVEPVSGERLTHAFDVGTAVFRAVSEALPLDYHYGRGWHNTSSTGRLAATAALAHLIGLDVERTRHALGIAASGAAGSLANFGTMTKPLHAGLAARDAVVAVGLARRGFTANPEMLETRRGFFAMYGESSPEHLGALGERLAFWETEWVTDWALKVYPSCYATHRAIDAAIEVHRQVGDPSRVAAVEVSLPHTSTSPLLDHLPTTGLEGKFSLDYTVCRAVLSGAVELADFTDERVGDPQVRRLMASYRLDARVSEAAEHHTTVTVTLDDGSVLHHGVDVTYGDARNPISDDDLRAKVRSALSSAGWEQDEADELADRLGTIPAAPSLGWLQDALGGRR
ncbi:MmgE/PrpD family protein [Nocardioides sp. cx-169]|uniref:MmgE/PrpD family protein n=1 Tax=Nocardioides sp. cx-169 TaxID=2899080 RepID=UPI001E5CF361|nr:MmgE/PrpD family protein [Nocardioides sp. cx-169]MCD4534309.1 MmgE/PrpD family protein [Nocardioides sp. cx-169]